MAPFYILVLVLLILFWKQEFIRNKVKLCQLKIPSSKSCPAIFEPIYFIIFLGFSNAEERFKKIVKLSLSCPDVMKLWLGHMPILFVSSPEMLKNILMSPKCLEKSSMFYSLMDRGDALITSKWNVWKNHRRFFVYAFNPKILQTFVSTFEEYSDSFCDTLKKELNNGDFDLLPYIQKNTFDILCATTFGTDMKDFSKKPLYDNVFKAYKITEEAMNHKWHVPFIYPHTIYKLTNMYKEEQEGQEVLNQFHNDIHEKRRNIIQEFAHEIDNDKNPLVGNILIDHMILNEGKLTSKQVRDHTIAFMFAYEVYASGISNMMLLLAMHIDVQQKCADEIMKVFPHNKTFDPDKINELPYLDMVTKEAFRLLPAIPLILRQTLEEFELSPGLVIPKGVDFLINLFTLQRRKDIWGKDADKFNPDNFLPENVAKRHPYSYLPFSGGQRNCMAYKYTMTLLKISLAKLLPAYQFSTTMKMKDIRIKSYVSMKLCTPHQVSIQKRIISLDIL